MPNRSRRCIVKRDNKARIVREANDQLDELHSFARNVLNHGLLKLDPVVKEYAVVFFAKDVNTDTYTIQGYDTLEEVLAIDKATCPIDNAADLVACLSVTRNALKPTTPDQQTLVFIHREGDCTVFFIMHGASRAQLPRCPSQMPNICIARDKDLLIKE